MSDLDISACELEPIRFPGSVQPDGALLVLQATTGIIDTASETCESLLGLRAEKLLGDDFKAALLIGPGNSLQPLVHFSLHGNALCARSNSNEAGQVLIDIEAVERNSVLHRGLIHTGVTGEKK